MSVSPPSSFLCTVDLEETVGYLVLSPNHRLKHLISEYNSRISFLEECCFGLVNPHFRVRNRSKYLWKAADVIQVRVGHNDPLHVVQRDSAAFQLLELVRSHVHETAVDQGEILRSVLAYDIHV